MKKKIREQMKDFKKEYINSIWGEVKAHKNFWLLTVAGDAIGAIIGGIIGVIVGVNLASSVVGLWVIFSLIEVSGCAAGTLAGYKMASRKYDY